jgi:hypothetical protein
MSIDITNRPRPIKRAADEIASWLSLATLLVGGLGGAGVNLITDEQASALTAVLAGIPGFVGAFAVLLAAFGIIRRSEPLVTPLENPMTADGERLYPSGR